MVRLSKAYSIERQTGLAADIAYTRFHGRTGSMAIFQNSHFATVR